MFISVCLLDDLIHYNNLTWDSGKFELAPNITLLSKANRLIKQDKHNVSCPNQKFIIYITFKDIFDDSEYIRSIKSNSVSSLYPTANQAKGRPHLVP